MAQIEQGMSINRVISQDEERARVAVSATGYFGQVGAGVGAEGSSNIPCNAQWLRPRRERREWGESNAGDRMRTYGLHRHKIPHVCDDEYICN